MTSGPAEFRGDHIDGFRSTVSAVATHGEEAFFTWFASAADTETSFVQGSWDFSTQIANVVAPYVRHPATLTAVEIGHGGGRLLAAACRHFKRVYGVDVHEESSRVAGELARRGVSNGVLMQTDGTALPLLDASADLVYSFIVLQHVQRIERFDLYIRETARILRPNGIGLLYYGRLCRFSLDRSSRLRLLADHAAERLVMRDGYREADAAVNSTNLRVSSRYAARVAESAGLEVLAQLVSRRTVPHGSSRFGGQRGLLVRRRGAR